MNKTEMEIFIEEMETIGDIWTLEEVEREYGNHGLEDALAERRKFVTMHLINIASLS